jgi:hypothetical protein
MDTAGCRVVFPRSKEVAQKDCLIGLALVYSKVLRMRCDGLDVRLRGLPSSPAMYGLLRGPYTGVVWRGVIAGHTEERELVSKLNEQIKIHPSLLIEVTCISSESRWRDFFERWRLGL